MTSGKLLRHGPWVAAALVLLMATFIWIRKTGGEELQFGPYLVRIQETPMPIGLRRIQHRLPGWLQERIYALYLEEPFRIEVWNGWTRVFHGRSYLISVVAADARGRSILGKDLNGDGIPNLVIKEYSGGAHCCYTVRIFSCGRDFSELIALETEHSSVTFEDLDSDGVPELRLLDWSYQYWPASFAGSPAPSVILRWRGRNLEVATDLMWKPAPSESELAEHLAEIRADPGWEEEDVSLGVPPILFQTALELMYSGHEEKGWKFIEEAWHPEASRELITELRDLMEASPYWQEIKQKARAGAAMLLGAEALE
jgi:hypothetical protein